MPWQAIAPAPPSATSPQGKCQGHGGPSAKFTPILPALCRQWSFSVQKKEERRTVSWTWGRGRARPQRSSNALRLPVVVTCVHILMETWLHDNLPDSVYQLDGLLLFRADRNHLSGKTRGGGVCIYINNRWCTNCLTVSSHCSEAVEYLTLKCWPYYLPWQYTVVFLVAVCIPPSANGSDALKELYDHIAVLQWKHPEAFFVVAGDFNHVELMDTLPPMLVPSLHPVLKACKPMENHHCVAH